MRSLPTDTNGNVLVYVTLIMGVLVGTVGIALDPTRLFVSDTEAQSAADAAAVAAASQLNGTATAFTRARDAAMNTPLVSNKQTYGDTADGSTTRIVSIRFLSSLPPNDEDPITAAYETSDPAEANFAEVTTETVTHRNGFLPVLGANESTTLTSTSVAGRGVSVCRITPLATCNPNEADPPDGEGIGADFRIGDWVGKQWIVKQNETSGPLVPGNFGYIDDPVAGDVSNASDIAHLVATARPPGSCLDDEVDVATGAKSSVRTGFNTRFDIYENPYFRDEYANPEFRPAQNVTKNRIWAPRTGGEPGAPNCGTFTAPGPMTAMGFPRDSNLLSGTEQFGNGDWDCATYWTVNHGGTLAGCTSSNPSLTRYQIYRMEIEDGTIGVPDNTATGGENGNPTCYEGPSLASYPDPDRRILNFAVINCRQYNVHGNMNDIPVLAYIKAFMTEPAGEPTSVGGADFDLPLEIIGVIEAGDADDILKETIQIYR